MMNQQLHMFGKYTFNSKNLLANLKVSGLCFHIKKFSSSAILEDKHKDYDIIISGGGMVGFSAGCALGRSSILHGKKILLLERQAARQWKMPEEYSNRVCALNFSTQRLFNKFGAWSCIENFRCHTVKQMQVWDACSEALIKFDESDLGEKIASIVENDVILESLKMQIPDNVEVAYDSRVKHYILPKNTENKVEVVLENGDIINADLLIGADGAQSTVRKHMGTQYLSWEYDQMGIVATLELSEEEEDNFVAWQKFLPSGPVAFLPLSSKRSSLVWSTTKEKARRLLAMSDIEFTDELNNAMWRDQPPDSLVQTIHSNFTSLVKTITPGSGSRGKQLPPAVSNVVSKSRAAFPLGLGHSAHYVAPRVVLIGDAAHRVHPLAGQGVNLGFGDVSTLVKELEKSLLLGEQLGCERALHAYETVQQRHNVASMMAIDMLYRLYSTTLSPIVALRSVGLSFVDSLRPLKKRIMQHAAG